MPFTIAEKLKIKQGYTLLTINAPISFEEHLQPLPEDVTISKKSKNYQQIHWFVKDKAQMEEELPDTLELMQPETICWIYYPKKTSGIQTDLSRDKGWENLLKHQEMQWISLISFDETWSAFGMRKALEKGKKKEDKPTIRAIFDYVDPVKKIIYLPDDVLKALKEAPEEEIFFQTLSFTNKKEYLEWIVSARKEETRKTRIQETISRLNKKWKNPFNR